MLFWGWIEINCNGPPVRDQDEAQACNEGAASRKKNQVGRSQVQIPVLANFFTAKSPFNYSPSLFISLYSWLYCMWVMRLYLFIWKDVTWKFKQTKVPPGGGKLKNNLNDFKHNRSYFFKCAQAGGRANLGSFDFRLFSLYKAAP